MTQTTIYISISDGWKFLAIDGHLDVLSQFLTTINRSKEKSSGNIKVANDNGALSSEYGQNSETAQDGN